MEHERRDRARHKRASERHGHCPTKNPSPTYVTYASMLDRCHNQRSSRWAYYGARGVVVCARWRESFAAFLGDMGERPDGHTLDRLDNAGNYEPGNCRWATPAEQCRNRRSTVLSMEQAQRIRALHSEGLGYRTIAKSFGVSFGMIRDVVKGRAWV
jgi:hypothetical protein